jgi:hypothetical protein
MSAGISVIRTRNASIAMPAASPSAIGLRRVALGHERHEHGEHDEPRGGDDLRGAGEAAAHGAQGGGPARGAVAAARTGVVHVLAHPRDEEHLVVHGQAEQHAHEDDRHEADDRTDRGDVQGVGEPAPLEHRGDHAERGHDRAGSRAPR